MAVVEFNHAADAKSAFKGVSYKRMGSSIIYLEWAPEGVWNSEKKPTEPKSAPKPTSTANDNEGDEEQTEPGSTLFVKNLNFSTTTERLIQAFRGLANFAFARVQMKPDPKQPPSTTYPQGGKLSMGYGFVGFKTADDAKRAMKTMNGYMLDRHTLAVSFAGRGTEGEKEDDGKGGVKGGKKTSKMIVKNVPFEATKKDIRELFRFVS